MVLQRALSLAIGLVASLLVVSTGCSTVPGEGNVRVSGRLVDMETGRDVSRRNMIIHAFDDQAGEQVTLGKAKGSEFVFNTTSPLVRLRIVDTSHEYKLYEGGHIEFGDGIKLEAGLRPTHFVRVHGRVLMGSNHDSLRPIPSSPIIGATPFVHIGDRKLSPDSNGYYSTRLPRRLHRIQTINFGGTVHPYELDLRDYAEDEVQVDVTLKVRGYAD